jgi:hypothetical protein
MKKHLLPTISFLILTLFIFHPHISAYSCSALHFNGTDTAVNCGSDAGLDNLTYNTFTAEAWIKADGWGNGTTGIIFDKLFLSNGWHLYINPSLGLVGQIRGTSQIFDAMSGIDDFTADGQWHHVAMTWNNATDRYIHLWLDGGEVSYTFQTTWVDAVRDDSSHEFFIGGYCFFGSCGDSFEGDMAWTRVSNNIRYSSSFTPDTRTDPPAIDGNTVAQWNMDECLGDTLDNAEGTGARDGTATDHTWDCDPANCDTTCPIITLTTDLTFSSDSTPTFLGNALDDLNTISSVVFQVDSLYGSWSNCTASDGAFDELSEDFTCDVSTPLSDGTHTIFLRSTNSHGNTTSLGSETSESFVIDATPPTANVSLNSDTINTGNNTVTLLFSASDETSGVSEMMLSEDPSFSGSSWIPYSDSYDFNFSGGGGTMTIYVRFRDGAGNVSQTYTVSFDLSATGNNILPLFFLGASSLLVLLFVRFNRVEKWWKKNNQ